MPPSKRRAKDASSPPSSFSKEVGAPLRDGLSSTPPIGASLKGGLALPSGEEEGRERRGGHEKPLYKGSLGHSS